MKRNITGLILGLSVATTTLFAADDASELRSEIDALSKRLATIEKENKTETKKADWTNRIKFKADLRYRFQYVSAEDTSGSDMSTKKNIQRIRARFGIFADVNDFTTAGFGIRTGKKANSGNVTLGDHFDGFPMSVSLAYFDLAPEDAKYGKAIFGKMKQPWKTSTDLIWDSDVNPGGMAYSYNKKISHTALFTSIGYFRVEEEKSTHDLNLGSAQIGVKQPFGEKIKFTLGGSLYAYDNAKDFTDPTSPVLPVPENYPVDYRIVEGFSELAFKDILPIPFKLFGNYVNNTRADDKNSGFCVGIKFGDAKKGKWEIKYDYRQLGLYAAPAYFTDSDFAEGGTGVRGHRIKGKYNFYKNLTGGITCIVSERTPARTLDRTQNFNTLMLDLMVKF